MTDTCSRRQLLASMVAASVAGCTGSGNVTTGVPTQTDGRTTRPPRSPTFRSEEVETAQESTTARPDSDPSPTTTPGTRGPVERTTDIVFRETPQRELKLDLYRPRSGSDHPFVVWAHGGGWVLGDKRERPMFDAMATEGYVVADIQYRLAYEKRYPAAVRDTAAAVKWVRDNARDYGIDGSTGALAGYSAGAHLATLVGLAPDHDNFQPVGFKPDVPAGVDAIVGYSGPYDFTVPGASENKLVENFFGEDASDATLAEGSPVSHVDPGDPATLLLHGTEDGTVPYRSTTALANALRAAGVTVEVFTGEGAGHNMVNDPDWRAKTLPRQMSFLKSHL